MIYWKIRNTNHKRRNFTLDDIKMKIFLILHQ